MEIRVITSEFLQDRQRIGRMANTVAFYDDLLRWLADYLAARGVTEGDAITPGLLEAYIADLKQRPLKRRKGRLSAVTVRNWTLTYKTFFAWAAGKGLIASDPMRSIPIPPKRNPLPKHLSPAQCRTLLSAQMHLRERAIISLMLDSGIRLAECTALDLADVEHELMTMLIRNGKRGKQRVIVYAESTREALRAYLDVRGSAGDALFADKKWKRLRPATVYKLIKRIGKSVGLNVSPHTFRHTFCTEYLNAGGKLENAKVPMGHERLETTLIYTHVATEHLQQLHPSLSPLNRIKQSAKD